MRVSTIAVTAVVLALLAFLLYPVVSDAGERRWITNERGETVGYLERAPLSDSRLVIRDRDGQAVGVIERKELGGGYVIRERNGERFGRVERGDEPQERGHWRDWRDGAAVGWGSHSDRWKP